MDRTQLRIEGMFANMGHQQATELRLAAQREAAAKAVASLQPAAKMVELQPDAGFYPDEEL
ncbi:MAG TPA: hypothetical protein VFL85_02645 [Candidatus Saccharimonadales bacterium]|nr:hypothetical protein [Candidatus Saccharimonadales bacterium]